ncbi:MAG: pectinesterase family protein [Moraxellaceae bacterium]|nr:pectinesterase family protein [Moraxellaceae bacterium]
MRLAHFVPSALLCLGLGLLSGCASMMGSFGSDAVVDASHKGAQGESVAGSKTYSRLQAAIDAAPADGKRPWRIFIRNGSYKEKLTVSRPNLSLLGESREATVLVFDAASSTVGPDQREYGTAGSATLTVRAPDFSAENLTIENAFDYPKNLARDPQDKLRLRNPQAVALLLDKGADRSRLKQVRLVGYQDTFFANAGRAWVYQSEVLGHVDFIFGAGTVVFEDSDIVSRPRIGQQPSGYVTAPSTQRSTPHGFVFLDSRLKRESADVGPQSVPLGRPWHPTSSFPDGRYADPDAIGSAVFVRCWMDEHITTDGWDEMGGTAKDGGRVFFQPEDARFFEYKSTGPGAAAKPVKRRRQLSDAQAAAYTPDKLLGDWRPAR